ncbi:MAG: mercury(II) reductase [Kiloniellaceae bacterium]
MADCCAPKRHARTTYDLAVIGAGSAGFSAAITAAEQGANVALIGHGTIGGTCVNVGCVPSKTLIRAVESLHQARAASRFAGITGSASVTDWVAVVRQKDDLVSSLRQAKYADLLPSYNGLAYLEGEARLTVNGVAINGSLLKAPKVIITTGARPAVPPIPGIEAVDYLTSTSALDLAQLPASLLIIGGGYVGAEIGQIFARAGVAVTIACRSRLLPAAELEIGDALTRYLAEDGIRVLGGLAYDALERTEAGIRLRARQNGQPVSLDAERVLIAAGRTPNIEDLGLQEAGVAINGSHGIAVDDRLRTTRTGTYAAGDVTGRDQFVYMAAYGAKIAARNALNGDRLVYDSGAMPAVVFTDPQVASVGLTEVAAKAQGLDVRTSVLSLDNVPRALAARDTRGLIKLVAERSSKRLVGAHILAPEGADSIQTAALAIRQGLTYTDLAEMIFPYLTTVEGLKLAAQTFEMDVSRLSCCAG